ncbi:hypothetical protein LSTR_LSTR003237 [Laodelphax striatellus]|uniref:F-box domain-containing protein n=1 Tax=Laodelphax striatellus TaxID=195883 RepID=A0A482XTT6_LAOST|nr:hypothetical protein LSTR_LSTR003237 [Laodelphax striatellus]
MVSTRQQSNVGGGNASSSCLTAQTSSAHASNSSCASSSHHHQGSSSDSTSTSKSSRHHVTSSSSSSSYHHQDLAASTVAVQTTVSSANVQLLDLPHEVLEKILSYIGYRNVSQLRLVCRHLDRVCSSVLNLTFQRLQNQMLHRFQAIKSKMPRRESARRTHPLACESDIIETLHMRLTLLQMSFGKHIERKHCCFFAGEILDEVYRILHYIKVTPKLARPYKVTDELFDLSTMAMEYFKEHIEPTLPEIAYFGSEFLDFSSSLPNSPPHGQSKSGDESPGHPNSQSSDEKPPEPCATPQSNIMLRKRIRKIKQGMKSKLMTMKFDWQIRHRTVKVKAAMNRQELNKCKTELQYWRSKSPMSSNSCTVCLEGVMLVGGGVVGAEASDHAHLHTGHAHSHTAHAHHSAGDHLAAADVGFDAAASFPAALPGTSAEEVWNAAAWGASEQDNKTAAAQPDETPLLQQTNAAVAAGVGGGGGSSAAGDHGAGTKRKASGGGEMRSAKGAKKARTGFKFRSKRL